MWGLIGDGYDFVKKILISTFVRWQLCFLGLGVRLDAEWHRQLGLRFWARQMSLEENDIFICVRATWKCWVHAVSLLLSCWNSFLVSCSFRSLVIVIFFWNIVLMIYVIGKTCTLCGKQPLTTNYVGLIIDGA
jgi:hypothetical protein